MRLTILLLLVIASALLADEQSDSKRMQGRWEITTLYIMGQDRMPVVREQKDGTVLQVDGDKMSGFNGEMKFKLDVLKKPKWMDITLQSGHRILEVPAIYELTANELKIVMAPAPTKPSDKVRRPESLESKEKSFIYLRARRAK
jgi:uncharacterized protein (TIGR03067 family)